MKDIKQWYSRLHFELVVDAVKTLKHATSYDIKDFTDNSAKEYVKRTHRKDLERCRMDLRTVQSKLSALKKEGKVNHDKDFKYYLTEEGYIQKLFGEPFGRALFESLTEIPLEGSNEEKLLDCVNRLGIYLIYIFIRGSSFNWGIRTQQIIAKYDTEWINEAIDGELLFKWFIDQFAFDNVPHTLKIRHYHQIMQPLHQYFPKLLQTLTFSEMTFNRIFFEHEFTKNKKWLDSFKSKRRINNG
jgi:hypothetical protein